MYNIAIIVKNIVIQTSKLLRDYILIALTTKKEMIIMIIIISMP